MARSNGTPRECSVVKSAVRVLEIFEFFDEIRGPANIVSIAKALDYPQSSAAALLRSMVAIGYLEYDAYKRTYLPTTRVPLLGSWVSPRLFRKGGILDAMDSLNRRTGAVALLATRNGSHAQYIHIVDEENTANIEVHIGQQRPLVASGAGWALLSRCTNDEVRKILHRMNAEAPSREHLVRFQDLSQVLNRVRQKLYALSLDIVADGKGMMAAVLPSSVSDRPLVLGLALPSATFRESEHEIAQALFDEIGKHLGGDVPSEPPCAEILGSTIRSRCDQREVLQ